ncbi:MAG: ATP-binding protein [Promethearchaeota archaeon]
MPIRDIIEIDEEKCNGCGLCIPNCAEGALQIVDGKARIVSEKFCDGLGACLGHCPQGALRVVKRKAASFDEDAVEEHLSKRITVEVPTCNCVDQSSPESKRQWPLALRLVPVKAPFFQDANLLVTADCVPFSYKSFHEDFPEGKTLVFGCPKFDDAQGYLDKLAEILRVNSIKDLTLVNMEVPCCFGLKHIVEAALAKSGKRIPLHHTIITTQGQIRG